MEPVVPSSASQVQQPAPSQTTPPVTSTPTVSNNVVPEWMQEEIATPVQQPSPLETEKAVQQPVMEESPPPMEKPITPSVTQSQRAAEALQSNTTVADTLQFVDEQRATKPLTESDKIINHIIGESLADKDDDPRKRDKPLNIVFPCQTSSEIGDALIAAGKSMGPQAFQESFQDNESYPSLCRDSLEHFNANTAFLLSALTDVKNAITDGTRTLKDVLQRNVGNIGATTTKGTPDVLARNKRVSGKDAVVLMASMTQGLKRIPLWNTGIYLTLRALSLKEIVSYYGSVSFGGYDYGRELGAWYFLYADYTVKKTVLEQLLPYALTGSNYKHWKNIKKLLSVISIQDYDVIIWAFASMMYREGVPVKLLCTHEDCQHVEDLTADIAKMRYVNTDKLNPDVIAFMSEPDKERKDNDLVEYRKMLNLEQTFKFKVENKATNMTTYWEMDFDTANCGYYLAFGDIFNTQLFEQIQAPTVDDVRDYLTINYYKAFLPWVAEVRCVEKEDFDRAGKTPEQRAIMIVDGTREDNRDALMNILDITQMEVTTFSEAVTAYIRGSRLSFIALPYFNCARCGRPPSTAVDGFIPYDVQLNFFQLCLMRMLASKD